MQRQKHHKRKMPKVLITKLFFADNLATTLWINFAGDSFDHCLRNRCKNNQLNGWL